MTYLGNIDHDLLRQELAKAGLPDGWYLTGATGMVEYHGEGEDVAQPLIEAHIAGAEVREANAAIMAQIIELENSVTPRRLREALTDPTWVQALDAQIAGLRSLLQ